MHEKWVIVRLDAVSPSGVSLAPIQSRQMLALLGYHKATKEQLHNYGPFDNMAELEEFARVNQINLVDA